MLRSLPDIAGLADRARSFWRGLGLARQFLFASALAIVIAMGLVGTWLSSRIEQSISQSAALDASLYVENVVGERIQHLAELPTFDPSIQKELEMLALRTPLGRNIISFKVWVEGSRIIYASRPEHTGKTYALTSSLRNAWSGVIAYELDSLHDAEDALERALAVPTLEIYIPVRKRFGGEIVAVVEFYEDATELVKDIDRAQREAWGLLAGIGTLVVAALYGMARRASRTIDQQRAALTSRIGELSHLLEQNTALRRKVETTSLQAAELNERYLRRLGSDLHDGPAQLISLGLMRLDTSTPRSATATVEAVQPGDLGKIRGVLADALKEIRDISVGLSLPELDKFSLTDVITDAVHAHEHRTSTRVRLEVTGLENQTASRDIKAAIYRLLQEGLNNAHRHAHGSAVTVHVTAEAAPGLAIAIADEGPGFDVATLEASDRLGLVGLRERLHLVGGKLSIISGKGVGTRLEARLPITAEGNGSKP